MEEFETLKVAELKALCKKRGVSEVGKKAELVERLRTSTTEAPPTSPRMDPAGGASPTKKPAANGHPAGGAGAGAGSVTTATGTTAGAGVPLTAATSPASRPQQGHQGLGVDPQPPITAAHVPSLGPVNPAVTTEAFLQNRHVQHHPSAKPDVPMTEEEKRIARAERFGVQNESVEKQKQIARAERFGLDNADLDREKRKQRAERFGVHNADLEAEKKKQRAERFGTESEEAKKAAREARFGTGGPASGKKDSKLDRPLPGSPKKRAAVAAEKGDEEEAKRQKRLERFGTSAMTESQKQEARAARFGTS